MWIPASPSLSLFIPAVIVKLSRRGSWRISNPCGSHGGFRHGRACPTNPSSLTFSPEHKTQWNTIIIPRRPFFFFKFVKTARAFAVAKNYKTLIIVKFYESVPICFRNFGDDKYNYIIFCYYTLKYIVLKRILGTGDGCVSFVWKRKYRLSH